MRKSSIENALLFDEKAQKHGIGEDGTIRPRDVTFLITTYPELKNPTYLQKPENKIGPALYKYWVPTRTKNTMTRPTQKVNTEPKSVAPQPASEVEAVKGLAENERVVEMNVETTGFRDNLVPAVDDLFVPYGNFEDIKNITASGIFYPTFITGLSGNGKTYMVEQICAQLKREVIRVNLTTETDEDALIGGLRLIAGETKFVKGPVVRAMERGAILLLDEIDLADPSRIMCLQSILEGSGYFVKRTGEYVEPKEGFTVIATANTKGKGSSSGAFIGTKILNEAFLERFPVTFENPYPPVAVEKRILKKLFQKLGIEDEDFIQKLVFWADTIRATYFDEAIDEIISTRRLVHISKAYAIFNDRMKAIELCTNRFDEETKSSFIEFYRKIDADVDKEKNEKPASIGDVLRAAEKEDDVPF